jgi:hypothetical protein
MGDNLWRQKEGTEIEIRQKSKGKEQKESETGIRKERNV